MTRFSPLLAAPVFVFLMGGVAHAALTADQVWSDWKAAAASAGLTLSAATEVNDGGVLTLNGVTLKGATTFTVSDMTLTEESDGSVTVDPAAEIKLSGAATGTLTSETLTLGIAEGEAGLDYDLAAEAVDLVMAVAGAAGADGTAADTFDGTFRLTALESAFVTAAGDNTAVEVTMTADEMSYDTRSAAPAMQMTSSQTSTTSDVSLTANVTLAKTVALMALSQPGMLRTALLEGMTADITMDQGEGTGTTKEENASLPMEVLMAVKPATTSLTADAAGVSMQSRAEGIDVTFTSPMSPVPVTVTSGAMEVGMTMPLIAADPAGDYGLTLKLAQLSVNEAAWAMIDPGKALPRDPADLVLDLGGTVKADMLALMEAQSAGMVEVTPPEPQTLDIREITLKIAGAALTGAGAFTFDNSAVAAGGAPVPVGTGNVMLTGGNKLIDGLIATGLLSEQDAAGPRMMMGAFMTPGEGDDVLTSAIEAKADGQILVNGQRIK